MLGIPFFAVLSFVLRRITAESGQAYHGPPPIKEVFTYNNRNYLLYSERVSWDEALAICKSNGGSLAIADDSGKANFLSESISEAWTPFEDMWIGGQKVKNAWQWISAGNKAIPDTTKQDPNVTFLYPPWVDGVTPNRFNRNCLAIDRNGHSDPFFVDLECRMPRPFICEQLEKRTDEDPVMSKQTQIFDTEYVLYHGRLSWEGAVAFCRQNGYTLASVKNLTVAHKLAVAMLKTRPEFEDVWIGAQFKNDKWTWVSDSEELEESEGYPPWQHLPLHKGKNCVLFDRHLCDEPKFIDVKCNRVRDFVCMKPLVERVTEPTVPKPIRFRRKLYVVHAGQLTWDEAKVICEDNEGGRMLEISDVDEIMFLMQAMADNKQEIDHVWLGGKLINDEWQWIYSGDIIPQPGNPETGFPPWCDNEKLTEMPCLNLDRQNHLTPLLYGLECNVTQGVICALEVSPKGLYSLSNEIRYFASYSKNSKANTSWDLANKICMEDTGSLLIDVDAAKLGIIMTNTSAGTPYREGIYFIGAKMQPDGSALWLDVTGIPNSKSVVTLSPLPPYTPGVECLAIRVKEGGVLESVINVNCKEVIPEANFICREACKKRFDEEGANKDEWKCDWVEGRGVDERIIGKQCWKHCSPEKAIYGSKKIMCTAHDWMGSHGVTLDPVCIESKDALSFVGDEIEKEVGAVFIIDRSDRVTPEDFRVFKYFVAATISRFLPPTEPGKKLVFHLIFLGSKSDEIIAMNVEKPCEVFPTLIDQLKDDDTAGRRDFGAALYSVKQMALETQNLTVFFMTGGPNQGDPFKETVRQIRKLVKTIVAVGITHYTDEELRDIASVSTVSKQLNMLGYSSSRYLKTSVDQFATGGSCPDDVNKFRAAMEGGGSTAVAVPGPSPTVGEPVLQ